MKYILYALPIIFILGIYGMYKQNSNCSKSKCPISFSPVMARDAGCICVIKPRN